jgi:hypothetical protein
MKYVVVVLVLLALVVGTVEAAGWYVYEDPPGKRVEGPFSTERACRERAAELNRQYMSDPNRGVFACQWDN